MKEQRRYTATIEQYNAAPTVEDLMKDYRGTCRDIRVEHGVMIERSGNTVWINVDGICVTRLILKAEAEINFGTMRPQNPKGPRHG